MAIAPKYLTDFKNYKETQDDVSMLENVFIHDPYHLHTEFITTEMILEIVHDEELWWITEQNSLLFLKPYETYSFEIKYISFEEDHDFYLMLVLFREPSDSEPKWSRHIFLNEVGNNEFHAVHTDYYSDQSEYDDDTDNETESNSDSDCDSDCDSDSDRDSDSDSEKKTDN